MTEQIQRKLSESKTARWSVLALVAFTMLCGYFITDMMAPLQDLLQTPVEGGGLGWTANEYGKFTSLRLVQCIFPDADLRRYDPRQDGRTLHWFDGDQHHAYRRFHQMVRYITQL